MFMSGALELVIRMNFLNKSIKDNESFEAIFGEYMFIFITSLYRLDIGFCKL